VTGTDVNFEHRSYHYATLTTQGDDGQGSLMSDRPLLAQPSMVSNSTIVDRPPKEAPQVGSPPLTPFRESLPQLPFFLQASRLENIRCLLGAKQFSEDAVNCLTLAQRRGTIDSYQSKCSVYQTWCGKEGVHPVFPTLLKYLFSQLIIATSFGCWKNVWDDVCMTAL
jgi:hypothetical protein